MVEAVLRGMRSSMVPYDLLSGVPLVDFMSVEDCQGECETLTVARVRVRTGGRLGRWSHCLHPAQVHSNRWGHRTLYCTVL